MARCLSFVTIRVTLYLGLRNRKWYVIDVTKTGVTGTGTIRRVPRPRESLPPDVQARLERAKERHAKAISDAQDELKAEVLAALKHGSVRRVAAASGVSPTTVQHWSQGRQRYVRKGQASS